MGAGQRFVMIFRSKKPSTTMEKVFSLYLPDLAQSSPFDDPETLQSGEHILLEEIHTLDESKLDTAYLLYSYLCKLSDSSELFTILNRTFGNNSQKRDSRRYDDSKRSTNTHTAPDVSSWYQTLGLSTSATLDEIKSAFRELMKKYHPDRFSTLSAEFQELANRKAQAIIEAYEFLINKMK
jgi:DnaJ-domain-containing protein 1